MEAIHSFLKRLDDTGIRYVHWKSNTNIEQALIGVDDLDILVDPLHAEKLEVVFRELGIIRAYSGKDNWQKGITHYVGMDFASRKLIHVHLHYQLSMGYDFDKGFNLPIVDAYLSDRTHYKEKVYLPSYANEYCVLVIRLMLKNALTPFLLQLPHRQLALYVNAKKGVVKGGGYREFLDLKSHVSREDVAKCLATTLSFVDPTIFYRCEAVLEKNNNLFAFFSAARKLKRNLSDYRAYGEIASFAKAFSRLYGSRFYSVLRKLRIYDKKYGKSPEHGGRIIAFVGGDGAGKTTTLSNLRNTLKTDLWVESVHVGRPKATLVGKTVRGLAKLASAVGNKHLSAALIHLSVAYNRKKAFANAVKLREQGAIVLQDRIPLKGITAMDCPRIDTVAKGKFRRLAAIERKLYKKIKGPDLLFVMKLNPQIALKRRPEDDAAELLIRSGQIWDDHWDAPYATVINTGENDPGQVQDILLAKVWENLCTDYVRAEVMGLNGTGKSTLFAEVSRTMPNVIHGIDEKEYPLRLAYHSVMHFIPAVRICLKTKNRKFLKIYFRIMTSMSLIRKWNRTGKYPAKNMIFDQGPLFQLALLYKENVISQKRFDRDLAEIRKMIPMLYFLDAPTDVLYARIKGRTGSITRGQYMDEADFARFCAAYRRGFDAVRDKYPDAVTIDTSRNDITQVTTIFTESLSEKK